MSDSEHSPQQKLKLFDLASVLGKMLPQLIIYAKKKDAQINSQVHSPARISGNNQQLKSVFKQLLYLLIKEIQTGGRIELSSRRENQHQIVTINVYGFLRYDITYESLLRLDQNVSPETGRKVHVTKFFFIYNTLKQNRSKVFISKLSPAHRIISLVLPADGSDNFDSLH